MPANVTRHSADALHSYNRLRAGVDLKLAAAMVHPRLPVIPPSLQPQRAPAKRQRHLATGGGRRGEPRPKRPAASAGTPGLLGSQLPPLPFWLGAALTSACVCACTCGRVCHQRKRHRRLSRTAT